jgi:hypothetical protein
VPSSVLSIWWQTLQSQATIQGARDRNPLVAFSRIRTVRIIHIVRTERNSIATRLQLHCDDSGQPTSTPTTVLDREAAVQLLYEVRQYPAKVVRISEAV